MSGETSIQNKILIGAVENIELPELKLGVIATRIDTGAKTSAIHVDHIEEHGDSVKFWFHPDFHDVSKTIQCEAKIHDVRTIKSSNGSAERRFVIKTTARIKDSQWLIELTLTDRSSMKHLMLLGREALNHRFIVDPACEFITG